MFTVYLQKGGEHQLVAARDYRTDVDQNQVRWMYITIPDSDVRMHVPITLKDSYQGVPTADSAFVMNSQGKTVSRIEPCSFEQAITNDGDLVDVDLSVMQPEFTVAGFTPTVGLKQEDLGDYACLTGSVKSVSSIITTHNMRAISLKAMLLAAFEERPYTVGVEVRDEDYAVQIKAWYTTPDGKNDYRKTMFYTTGVVDDYFKGDNILMWAEPARKFVRDFEEEDWGYVFDKDGFPEPSKQGRSQDDIIHLDTKAG